MGDSNYVQQLLTAKLSERKRAWEKAQNQREEYKAQVDAYVRNHNVLINKQTRIIEDLAGDLAVIRSTLDWVENNV